MNALHICCWGIIAHRGQTRCTTLMKKMHNFPRPNHDQPRAPSTAPDDSRYIYIACPWSPGGGGMYKVADYLIQCQSDHLPNGSARLRALDTRGSVGPRYSLWVLLTAIARIAAGRLQGNLAGVHVNLATRMSLFRKGTLIVACAALGVPTVLHLHAQMNGFYERLPAVLRTLTRWVFSLPQGVIVIGPAAKGFVIDMLQLPADRVHTIINGVPEPDSVSVTTPGSRLHRVLFLANLSDRKGLLDLLQALAHPALDTTGLTVTIAGGGNVAGYQAKARELGVSDLVRFEGWCDQRKVSRLLANSDMLVLPSHDEVLPLAILEALAHGVAVVTTAVGEIPSLLTDGVDAVFVTVASPARIAAGMQKVLKTPGLKQTLASNGRALYARHFCLSSFFFNIAGVHQRYFGLSSHMNEKTPSVEDLQERADGGAMPPDDQAAGTKIQHPACTALQLTASMNAAAGSPAGFAA